MRIWDADWKSWNWLLAGLCVFIVILLFIFINQNSGLGDDMDWTLGEAT